MKRLLIAGVVGFGLAGCATPKYNYHVASKDISKPPIGSTNTVDIGDKLLVQGKFTEREALYIAADTKVGGYKLGPGYYLKTGDDSKAQYYRPVNQISNGGVVQMGFLTDPFQAVMLGVDKKLCVISVMSAKTCTTQHEAKPATTTLESDDSFQQTLIYSGKVGNKINIGYREFSSNMARPAFNNSVEYDLNESKQIGYKGALLEVVDANNQNITYKVLRNFNKTDN